MAALVLPVLGQAVGSALLPGSLGFLGLTGGSVGWLAGSLLASSFQTQKTQGPRLSDLSVSGSSYGAPLPYVIGHDRISCQVIWASRKREISTTTTRRAKGGPKVSNTSFTYEVDLLVKFTSNEMAGLRKMFINGELQWTAATDADFGSINASTALARRITVYPGSDDQLPDPTYEAAVGEGAPAYIGSLTVFFEGLQLGTNGQIPNIEGEVVQRSTPSVQYDTLLNRADSNGVGIAFSDNQKTWAADAVQGTLGNDDWRFIYVNATKQRFDAGNDELVGYAYDVGCQVDRPVLVGGGPISSNTVKVNFLDGRGTLTYTGQGIARRAHIRGDVMTVFTFNGWLNRYDLVTGFDALASVSPALEIRSMLVRDDELYCFAPGVAAGLAARTIYVYDLETLTLLDTMTTPLTDSSSEILEDEEGYLLLLGINTLWRYDGSSWSTVMSLATGFGAFNSTGNPPQGANPFFLGGALYTTRIDVSGFGAQSLVTRVAWPALDAASVPLNEVVEELSERAGTDPAFLDASALASKSVRGYSITPTTTRAVLDTLAQAYQFECSPGEVLKMVPLGGNVVATIPFEDLASAEYGNQVTDALPIVMRNDRETPGFITVKYKNANDDYQDGSVRSARISTDSDAEQFVEFALVLTPTEAKKIADFLANLLQASMINVNEIALQTKWTRLMPCDPVLLTDRDGSTYRVRLQQRDDVNGLIRFTAVFDNQASTDSDGVTDDNFANTSTIRTAAPTDWVYGDWPLFRDVDDNIGFYWAADGVGDFWPGSVLLESPDDVAFGQVSQIDERGVVGTTNNVLGPYSGHNVPDEINTVAVYVGDGELSSITYEEQLAGEKNVFMVGAECVIARRCTYISEGFYRLESLLRGRKGTEWAMDGHVAGERVALIQMAGIRRVTQDLSKINDDFYYRAPTVGRPLDSAASRLETNTGVSAKCYAPTDLLADRAISDDETTVTWSRRTRLSENWLEGIVPLGEEVERWRVRRYTDGTYTTVMSEDLNVPTAEYTFSTSTYPLYLGVAQWSARVGWGYELLGAI